MSDSPPAGPPSGAPAEAPPRGVSRAVGLGVAAATAVVVFAAGMAIFPVSPTAPPPPAPVAVTPPQPPVPAVEPAQVAVGADAGGTVAAIGPETADAAPSAAAGPDAKEPRIAMAEPEAAHDAPAAEEEKEPTTKRGKKRKDRDKDRERNKDKEAASATATATAKNEKAEKAEKPEKTLLPPSDGTAAPVDSSKDKESPADCALAEKDMAREAWRRNWPTVCPIASSGKAFMLIPIKGSIEGETHELRRRPDREARVTLPAGAESQLTLKQYKVKRLGFKELRVSQDGSGATLRVKLLPGAGDPVFEVKDGYAKITVATP